MSNVYNLPIKKGIGANYLVGDLLRDTDIRKICNISIDDFYNTLSEYIKSREFEIRSRSIEGGTDIYFNLEELPFH